MSHLLGYSEDRVFTGTPRLCALLLQNKSIKTVFAHANLGRVN